MSTSRVYRINDPSYEIYDTFDIPISVVPEVITFWVIWGQLKIEMTHLTYHTVSVVNWGHFMKNVLQVRKIYLAANIFFTYYLRLVSSLPDLVRH
jgi:hypothetical protein